MDISADQTEAPISNYAFSALILSISGWALLQARAFYVGAPVIGQIYAATIGVCLCSLTVRRYRLFHGIRAAQRRRSDGSPRPALMTLSTVGSGILLIVVGALFGRLVLSGLALPLTIFCGCLVFGPWSRVPLCRDHFFASTLLVVLSAAAQLIIAKQFTYAFTILIPVWVIWSMASVTLLFLGTGRQMTAGRLPDAGKKRSAIGTGENTCEEVGR